MIEIFISVFLGIFIGILTGIIPGIHVNTVTAILLTLSYTLSNDYTSSIVIFIASLSVSHTYFDIIPSLFLGIPGDSSFALLPGHDLVKKGKGILAIRLSIIGSLLGLALGIGIAFLFIITNFSNLIIKYLPNYIFYIIIVISFFLVLSEKNKIQSLIVFIVSGLFGLLVFNSPLVPSQSAPINLYLPALSGLFGVSGILWSLYTYEKENFSTLNKSNKINYFESIFPSIRGAIAGIFVGIVPGLGSANAATMLLLIEKWFGAKKDNDYNKRSYLITTSSLSTSEALISILTLYIIGKSRSGASVAIEQIIGGMMSQDIFTKIIISMIFSGLIASVILWYIGPFFASKIKTLNYPSLNWSILTFIFLMVFLLIGVGGISILIVAVFVGLLPFILNVRKGQLMGFFLIPIIIYYSESGRNIYESINITQRHEFFEFLDFTYIIFVIIISILLSLGIYLYTNRISHFKIKQNEYIIAFLKIIFLTGIISFIYPFLKL